MPVHGSGEAINHISALSIVLHCIAPLSIVLHCIALRYTPKEWIPGFEGHAALLQEAVYISFLMVKSITKSKTNLCILSI
jgi:hypothetical protein